MDVTRFIESRNFSAADAKAYLRAGRPNENGGREHDATCSTTQPTSGRHTERAHQILLIVVLSRYEKFPRTVLCRVRAGDLDRGTGA